MENIEIEITRLRKTQFGIVDIALAQRGRCCERWHLKHKQPEGNVSRKE